MTETAIQPDPRDQKRYYVHETFTRRALVAVLTLFSRCVMRIQAVGSENIPEDGAVILACNHVTNYDVFPMQLSIRRPIFFMAKAELHRNPVMDYFLRKAGAFPVHRGQNDDWAKRQAEKVLANGQVLGLFPEGTRSKGRGLQPAKTGAARFAIKFNCPIVPMAVNGSHRVFKEFPRRTLVMVKIGEPIYPQPDEGPLALTDRVMYRIAAMLPEDLRGVYAEIPPGFVD